MQIILGINCKDKKCFSEKLKEAKSFLPKNSWIHIDVADKKFTKKIKTFVSLEKIREYSNYFKFEAHLMIDSGNIFDKKWFESKISRILIHSGAVKDWKPILNNAKKYKKTLGVVVSVSDKIKDINFPKQIKHIQVLAVISGPSGQKMNKKTVSLISVIKKKYPNAKIFVDGGVNNQTIKKLKMAHVDGIISTSYVWKAKNKQDAIKSLAQK